MTGHIIWKNSSGCVIDVAPVDPKNEEQVKQRLLSMIENGVPQVGDSISIQDEDKF